MKTRASLSPLLWLFLSFELASAQEKQTLIASNAQPNERAAIRLGAGELQLFVDDFLIEKLAAVQLRLHEPRREGVALKFDRPWEGVHSAYPTVIKDGAIYRMYYRGLPVSRADGSENEVVCYAESPDGITWTKPNLGVAEVHGTRENNVVLTQKPFAHNFSPFLDQRPDVASTERYKAVAGLSTSGVHGFKSSDGIHWSEMQPAPLFTKGAFDSQNVAFWSPTEQRYICYFRTFKNVAGEEFRWVSRTTSDDFQKWTEPVEMEFGDAPPEHLYTNGTHPYFRAPQIYIALAKRFFPTKAALPAERAKALVADPDYRVASSDSVFMTTRGGNRYDRTFMEGFIRPGPSAEDWVSRDNIPALGVVPGNAREMFIYRMSHYAQPTSHISRYSLRTDGFVSVNASFRGGELLTKPLTFAGGKLEINFVTSAAGGIRLEIQDENGQAIPGFSLSDSSELMGDEISRVISWSRGSDVSSLAGKVVRLRFAMKDADLYSLRFF